MERRMFKMYGEGVIRIWLSENAGILFRMLFAIYLLILTVMDIRTRQLHLGVLLLGFPLAVAGRITLGNIPAALVVAGGASGALFVIVSRMTEEAFGYGDSILITITGIFLGIWDLLAMLVTAFFLAAVFSGIMLSRKIYTRKSSFPFVPFLAAAYLGGVVIGAYG